jgi:serine/threonine protein kinase
MVKKVGKYELGRGLGEGTFGKVKYAVDTETNGAVAIKILDKEKIQKQNMGNQIKKEISIMKMVKHKYIVGMVRLIYIYMHLPGQSSAHCTVMHPSLTPF